MSQPNYESKWWGYIYDQMMENLQEIVDNNMHFYQANLQDVSGPVLECACGTGIFLLPLLAAGHDMHGFDISRSMLATLTRKAKEQGVADIEQRISVQDFQSFRYDQQFAAITIPTNTFLMLTTQAAQIKTLQNIYAHLAPGGKFLLDIRLAGLRDLVEAPIEIQGQWYTWKHPETGLPIRQRIVGRQDFNHQLTLDHCFIEYEAEAEDFPMTGRWIFKEEFQLLLRLAGFQHWASFGTPARDPLEIGLEETRSYWIVYKE
ncbi:MAG: class I SAM-dependent methyltransferase [Chloroflexi bacterium]|nr:class I SAM-dependent methyltransferase [Chloroflexota bacterium]